MTTILAVVAGVVVNVITGLTPSTVNSAGEVLSASGLSCPNAGSYTLILFLRNLLPPTNISNSLTDLGVKDMPSWSFDTSAPV